MSTPTCPKCGVRLKYKEIMRTAVVFPCPACGIELGVTKLYGILTFYGTLVAPALIFWALGSSWPHVIIAELVLAYPASWLMARYDKYILRPKIVVHVPPMSFAQHLARLRARRPPPAPLGGRTELHLRDRPRPPWV
jgi:hypothetical protein